VETLIAILIPVLIQIESSGNDLAVGDGGKSIGCLQISAAYWADGCGYGGYHWDYPKGAYNRQKSIKVTTTYLAMAGKHYERVTGKKATMEVLARCHNGGFSGYKKDCTLKYWARVKKELEK